MDNKEDGFSLAEIMVGIVILGILTSIAVGATLSQRNKGREASVQQDVQSMAAQIQQHWVGALKTFPASAVKSGNTLPVNKDGVVLYEPVTDPKVATFTYKTKDTTRKGSYCITVSKKWNKTTTVYSSKTGKMSSKCTY